MEEETDQITQRPWLTFTFGEIALLAAKSPSTELTWASSVLFEDSLPDNVDSEPWGSIAAGLALRGLISRTDDGEASVREDLASVLAVLAGTTDIWSIRIEQPSGSVEEWRLIAGEERSTLLFSVGLIPMSVGVIPLEMSASGFLEKTLQKGGFAEIRMGRHHREGATTNEIIFTEEAEGDLYAGGAVVGDIQASLAAL